MIVYANGHARAVREHFYAGLDYQDKLARFLENHDEPRAAQLFNDKNHEAAAMITFFSPGLRFFHQGQFEGRKKRISPHLVRAPHEPVNTELQNFYNNLLPILKKNIFRDGNWQLLQPVPAWEGNESWDSFVPFGWTGNGGDRALVLVNYSASAAQSYVRLPFSDLAGGKWRLQNLVSDDHYDRPGNDLISRGLYLDLPAWGFHVFELKNLSA